MRNYNYLSVFFFASLVILGCRTSNDRASEARTKNTPSTQKNTHLALKGDKDAVLALGVLNTGSKQVSKTQVNSDEIQLTIGNIQIAVKKKFKIDKKRHIRIYSSSAPEPFRSLPLLTLVKIDTAIPFDVWEKMNNQHVSLDVISTRNMKLFSINMKQFKIKQHNAMYYTTLFHHRSSTYEIVTQTPKITSILTSIKLLD